MRLLYFIQLMAISLFTLPVAGYSQESGSDSTELLRRPLTLVAKEIHQDLVLKLFATRAGIGVGFLTSREICHQEPKKISISIVDGTVREFLDAFVSADSRYQWQIYDGVVNIAPRVVQDFVDIPIGRSSFRDVTLEQLRTEVLGIKEVKSGLEGLGLSPSRIEIIYGFEPDEIRFSVELDKPTFRNLLNEVVRKRHAKFWSLNYSGSSRQYAYITLN